MQKKQVASSKSVKQKNTDRNTFDSPWKDVLGEFFKDFIEMCFPTLAKDINWKKGISFLDKELGRVIKGSETGKRIVDKLVKVFIKDGKEFWILVHLEVQAKKEAEFPERMQTYKEKLSHYYHVPILSIAILIDDNKNWKPDRYHTQYWFVETLFKYGVVKVLDYESKRKELENSMNPFATVLLAQLEAITLAKKNNAEQRLVSKIDLFRRLCKKGFTRETIINLTQFIDWVIQLPELLMVEYINEVYKIEESANMAYMTTFERLGRKEGKKEGRQEAEAAIVKNLYKSLKDITKVAKLSRLSIRKVREILNMKEKQN